MENVITHVIYLRPESLLNALFLPVGRRVKQLDRAVAVECLSVEETLPGFLCCHATWSYPAYPRPFQIPLSEILLIADVQDSDPQPIGFLRE